VVQGYLMSVSREIRLKVTRRLWISIWIRQLQTVLTRARYSETC
jgi:hypothetical protein